MRSPIEITGGRPVSDEIEELLRTARADAASGEWRELRDLLAPAEQARRERPELALLLAEAELRIGDPASAQTILCALVPTLADRGDADGHRRALNLLGGACFALGEVSEAHGVYVEVLERARDAADPLLEAKANNNLGAIANLRGNREDALARYERALALYQQLGVALGLAETHHNLAISHRDLNDFTRAEEHERRALEYAVEAGSDRVRKQASVGLAELALLLGDARAADATATRAAVDCAAAADPYGESNALRLVGEARAAIGDPQEALQVLERAIEAARRTGNRLHEAEALRARAAILSSVGLDQPARAAAARSRALFERLGARVEPPPPG